MTLSEKQRLFSYLLAKLILEAYNRGYEITFGEVYRSDEQAEINALGHEGRLQLCQLLSRDSTFKALATAIANNPKSTRGIRRSLHTMRLAADLNLWKNGKYLEQTEQYREIGELWEQMNPLCRWGGRFGDGNHFSLEHEGIK